VNLPTDNSGQEPVKARRGGRHGPYQVRFP